MTTLAQMTYRVARIVTDVLEGSATAGATTSLTDATRLIQPNEYWAKGILWMLTGSHAGKVLDVLTYLDNKLTFATLTPAIAVGNRYGVARGIFPHMQLIASVNDALQDTWVIAEDASLIGDGESLEFILPVGVKEIERVEVESDPLKKTISTHWKEEPDLLRFDYGYAPRDGDVLHIFFREDHETLAVYDDEIHPSVNTEWLRWKAAEYALYWAAKTYGDDKTYNIEILMNRVMEKLKGKHPQPPTISVRTAG